ncbi:MAG TPA: hypothetical protein VK727_07280 [Steroidobacteraceae bacterium]|nr:hypothetical protein [Steroidobacteraceae bacterium]
MDSDESNLEFAETISPVPNWIMRLRFRLADDLGLKRWFLESDPSADSSTTRFADGEDEDDDEDHLFAASMAAAGVLALFVILAVACAVILAARLLTD